MLDSSLLVAGVVIGVVLFLSCVAIIIGSLRNKRCFQHLQLQRDARYTPNCFSYGSSTGEIRSSCTEEFPPDFYFSSYIETLPQADITYPDSPPRYDECLGPGAAQICLPTDDPPPYSLIDPCQRNELAINMSGEEEELPYGTVMERNAGYLIGLQDSQQPISSVSLSSSLSMEAAPPYETVVHELSFPLPLAPLDRLKNSRDWYQTFFNRII
ncbi:hypothetical protein JRQ81_006301 [Phrynocephalus forsythii]|uniref:Uncharacterized protein n=1 Tax=Phrynocephalus forsythii TaxID=171643 RepID=A0A9Q0XGH9_9SAUR|nr:hypothetical protein JRQ81_006301 [Phrynocephalus forsythii]